MRARKSLDLNLTSGRWDATTAGRLLKAWRASGQSLVAFARERGIGSQRLYWWRKRLRAEAGTPIAPMAFIPATVTGAVPAARVAVRLPGGVEVDATGTDAVPAEWVAALVRALASKP